jgi:predicted negative regulator of RcsB-dependent stress response
MLFFVFFSLVVQAQDVTVPRPSPSATVSQTIGVTELSIVYSSPAVKGRKIWGSLVPYDGGRPNPWRAGANENTTFTTTHDLMIQGKRLPAGTYGIHMIPSEHEWTIIFSGNHTSWGSFFYKEEEDALRIVARPEVAPHCEWLRYGFEDLEAFGATVYLHWEKIKIGFPVEVADGHKTILANFRNELRGLAGFASEGYSTAARYCVQHKINYDEALQWTDRAIANGGGFQARMTRGDLLALTGKGADGIAAKEAAIESATENELNNYGYQLLNDGNTGEAVRIFTMNVERFPGSWNVYDSLGEGYDRAGDTQSAIAYYQKALEKDPPANQVERINGILKALEVR